MTVQAFAGVTPPTEASPSPRWRGRGARLARRGFTLVELMIALAAGIAVAGAAYVLSQSSLDIFRQEERMAAAQTSATLGMNRMLTDLQRAGFMMSPNINNDVGRQCGSLATYSRLLSLSVITGGSGATAPASVYNNLTPDKVRIGGNLSTTEQFEFRQIDGTTVYLSMDRGAMQRTLQQTDYGGPTLRDIFRPNVWVRIVDSTGRENYRQVSSVACGGSSATCMAADATSMTITLTAQPTTNDVCGPGSTRGLINPVSFVEYWIGTPTAGVLATADAITSVAPVKPLNTGDDSRTELLRTEVWDTGAAFAPIPNDVLNPKPATTVVSEYAVDLAFGATIRATTGPNPTLSRLDFQDVGIAGTLPERFVSLTVRLTTRTRAPDRRIAAASPDDKLSRFAVFKVPLAGPVAPPIATFGAGNANTDMYFARTRSLTTEVNLPNLAGTEW